MKKKQILALILSAALTLSLTACSDNNEQPNNSKDKSSKTSTSSNTTPENSDNSKDTDSGSESESGNSSDSTSSSSSDNTSSTPEEQPGEDKYTQAFWDSLQDTPGSDFEYQILAEGIGITKYTGTSDTVKVPAVIDGEPVRAVSFSSDSNIKVYYPPEGLNLLEIPSTVTALYVPGSYTVFNCDSSYNSITFDGQSYRQNACLNYLNLESITFGSGIKAIALADTYYREYPSALKYVHLPEGLEVLCRSCFKGCTSLESIVIPNSVTNINSNAFQGCTGLKNVTLPNDAIVYSGAFDETPFLEELKAKSDSYIKLGASIYDGSKCTGDVVIPDGIKIICTRAFYGNDKITSVTIPSTVEEIDGSSFAYCARLKTVTINGSPNIWNYAFQDCLRLEEVICTDTPVNKATYDRYPFWNCPNLKTKPF